MQHRCTRRTFNKTHYGGRTLCLPALFVLLLPSLHECAIRTTCPCIFPCRTDRRRVEADSIRTASRFYLRGVNHYGDGSGMPWNLMEKHGAVSGLAHVSVRDRVQTHGGLTICRLRLVQRRSIPRQCPSRTDATVSSNELRNGRPISTLSWISRSRSF